MEEECRLKGFEALRFDHPKRTTTRSNVRGCSVFDTGIVRTVIIGARGGVPRVGISDDADCVLARFLAL